MKKIKDLKIINNTNSNPDDFQQPANLDGLTAPIVNENKIRLFHNFILMGVKDPQRFRKNLFSDLEKCLAEFLEISKDSIDPSSFDIPQLSIEHIKALNLELRAKIEESLPYQFSHELSYHDSYRKSLESDIPEELEKIDKKDYDELYNKKFTEYYERYTTEKRNNARYEAEYAAKHYINSEISASKNSIKRMYTHHINIKDILEKCYNKIVEKYLQEQEQEKNDTEKTLGTVSQN